MLGEYKFKKNNRPVFGVKDAFYKEEETPRFSGINDIIKATRQQNFLSPFIHAPEKQEIFPLISPKGTTEEKQITDAPRKREPDKITQGIIKGLSSLS